MKKYKFFEKSKSFFRENEGIILIAGLAISGITTATMLTVDELSGKNAEDKSIVSESNSVPALELVIQKVVVSEDAEAQTYDYVVNVEKTDGTTEWLTAYDLSMGNHSDLVSKVEMNGTIFELMGMDENGKAQYRQMPTYNVFYMVYNEDGTKEYRSLVYLNQYISDVKTNETSENAKIYKSLKR